MPENSIRRIKLVVSDFHLGVGRRFADGSLNRMEDFIADDRFVEFMEHYSTGSYTNAEVELIINGDFFNMIQVDVDGSVPSNISEAIALKQMERILDGHSLIMDTLRAFAEMEGKSITFTVGNHDAGLIWPSVKKLLKSRLSDGIQILNRSYVFDGVHIEHGDKYEPVHFVDPKLPYLSKGLDEPILNIPWATHFFIHFVRPSKLKRSAIDKVKPFRDFMIWSSVFDFFFFARTMIRLAFFLLYSLTFARVGRKRFGLRLIPMFLRQWKNEPEFASAKRILKQPDIHTVVFGHTHAAMHRPVGNGKEYFNTGCWNGVTQLAIDHLGYHTKYTYAHLDWGDEQKRWLVGLREWQGRSRLSKEYWS